MSVASERKTNESNQLALDFARLTEQVLATAPVLKETLKKNGDQILYNHALQYKQIKINPAIKSRQAEFISSVAQRVEQLLGAQVSQSVAKQLEKNYFVSTADHHQPIGHPFFLNGNLLTAITQTDFELENIIVLSCANVSLNNSSFPRGLIFHSDVGDVQELHRLSFFPAHDSQRAVYGLRSYTQKDLDRVKKLLKNKLSARQIGQKKANKILDILNTIYSQPEVLGSKSYSEQITKTNFDLWQQLFAPYKKLPNLIYIDQETVTSSLLIKHHLDQKTIINQIIFNKEYQNLVIKYFEGIIGAFSGNDIGTFLFWALPHGEKYRQRLRVKDGELVNNNGTFRVSLTVATLSEKLQSGELIPSMLLTFIVISFYYGVTCLGGFSQPSYLTAMKEGYMQLLQEIEDNTELGLCKEVETQIMGGDMALTFLQDKEGGLHHATSLDLILYGTNNTWNNIVESAKTLSFQNAVESMMPLFYEVMYPENKREKKLRSITVEQITHLTGLDKKIKPCVEM